MVQQFQYLNTGIVNPDFRLDRSKHFKTEVPVDVIPVTLPMKHIIQ